MSFRPLLSSWCFDDVDDFDVAGHRFKVCRIGVGSPVTSVINCLPELGSWTSKFVGHGPLQTDSPWRPLKGMIFWAVCDTLRWPGHNVMQQMIEIEIHMVVAGFWFQTPLGVSHPQNWDDEPNLFHTFSYKLSKFGWVPVASLVLTPDWLTHRTATPARPGWLRAATGSAYPWRLAEPNIYSINKMVMTWGWFMKLGLDGFSTLIHSSH